MISTDPEIVYFAAAFAALDVVLVAVLIHGIVGLLRRH